MGSEWMQTTWGDEISLEYGKRLRGYADGKGSVRVFGTNGPVGWTFKPLAPGSACRRSGGGEYNDIPGFCKSSTTQEIASHGFVLTPGRYVGAEDIEDDGIPFEEKMAELSSKLYQQMRESKKLDGVIRKNLDHLGYGE